MDLKWFSWPDEGSPVFSNVDDLKTITIAQSDRGRWLSQMIKVSEADTHKLTGGIRVTENAIATVVITFWKQIFVFDGMATAAQLGSAVAEFDPFSYEFTIPAGVVYMRIELRLWDGHGTAEYKAIALDADPAPDPDPDPPWPQLDISGFWIGDVIIATLDNRPTGRLADATPIPIRGIVWDQMISAAPETGADPDPPVEDPNG